MTDTMREVLESTEKTLCRHLEDLNDEVGQDGGRIKDHMVLDGIKDCLKSLKCLKELYGSGVSNTAKVASQTATSVK